MTAPADTAPHRPAASDDGSAPFSAEWLSLREPMDIDARPLVLVQRLAAHLPKDRPLGIVDLGCGTGSNLRALAPALPAAQVWRMVDQDPLLLRELPHRMRPWAEGRGLLQRWEDADESVLVLENEAGTRLRLELEVRDLSGTADSLDFAGRDLVTASALMDLVSADWLEVLADTVTAAGAALYAALTYTGKVQWTPVDPMDEEVTALLNRHQRGDKGFGPAVGPEAPQALANAFLNRGYTVTTEPSDWHAEPEAVRFQTHLIEDFAAAAAELTPPDHTAALNQWRQRRLQAVERGHSRVRVGHVDLLAHR